MKIEIKGIGKVITPVVTRIGAGKNGADVRKQSLVVTVRGYRDEFGQQLGKDEDFELQLFNDKIEKYNLQPEHLWGKPLICEGYLKSRAYKSGGEDKYELNLILGKVSVFVPQQNA